MNTALYILCYILISVVLLVLGVLVPIWTSSWYKNRKKKEQDDILMKEAIKDLLRGSMLYLYNEASEEKKIYSHYDLECFMRMYNTYHSLGGNSFIDECKEEYLKYPICNKRFENKKKSNRRK